MIKFFEYNWQVRDEWFNWSKQLTEEELHKERIGGVGSILSTLIHIIDVEYSWVRSIKGEEDIIIQFSDYNTLEKVKSLSDAIRFEIAPFLKKDLNEFKEEMVNVSWADNKYTKDEIIHHIIAHEIHHIGQLSIWAREMALSPISAHFVGRKLTSVHSY